MSERDRPKKSWREIDSGRDRSDGRGYRAQSAASGGADGRARPMENRSSQQYRAALDALFTKGEIGKVAEKLAPPPLKSKSLPLEKPDSPSEAALLNEQSRATLRK